MATTPYNRDLRRTDMYTSSTGDREIYDTYRLRSRGWRMKPLPPVLPPMTYQMSTRRLEAKFGEMPNGSIYGKLPLNHMGHYLDWAAGFSGSDSLGGSAVLTSAMNAAYSRFVEQVRGVRSELGTALVEGRSAVDMVQNRALALARSYRELRRGNFRGFLDSLSTRPKRKHREMYWSRPKDASSLWLEYWMGWAPSVSDIYNSVAVLTKDRYPDYVSISAGARRRFTSVRNVKWDKYEQRRAIYEGEIIARIGADVRCINPNLALMSDLGLVNPASVAWQVVPFSFLVDWFGNVGDCLNSFSDLWGFEVVRPYNTAYHKLTASEFGIVLQNWGKGTSCASSGSGVAVRRQLGIPSPVLQFSIPERLSVTRAATSISLLISLFTGKG